ncbi:MAG TPA: ArsA family ATPase [Solirubrobacteraceae bacterium]|jgi:anion-transporting  ArsA/GET3 family ATPase|nr:ArsA family ATPase [Solirubrobacteraceae bacterium]
MSLLERELLVVTGKGGVGKTTLATAIGLLAAELGLRTIVVELGEQARVPELFGAPVDEPGAETRLSERLWSISIDPDRALLEWLQALGGRVSGRVLASSSTFGYFAAAAPGAKELVSMVKIWDLTQRKRRRGRTYDLVVLDAPATGHALGLLDSPRTFGAIARVGPIAGQAERLGKLLADPTRSGYLAVAHPTEMAITETLDLQDRLQQQLARDLDMVVVNGVLPQRFSAPDLKRLAPLADSGSRATATAVRRSALAAARAVSDRARFQHNQLARLRRRKFEVVSVPFQFTAELDLAAIGGIAEHLRRKL